MGGNIFENTRSIKKSEVQSTIENFIKTLKEVLQTNSIDYGTLGSTGIADVSGDIDIVINSDYLTFLDKYLLTDSSYETYKKRARTSTDTELRNKARLNTLKTLLNNKQDIEVSDKITPYSIYTKVRIANTEDYVQLDLNISDDIEYTKFIYSSEKTYKGFYQTQLLLACFRAASKFTLSHTKGLYTPDFSTKDISVISEELSKILGRNVDVSKLNTFNSLIYLVYIADERVRDKILKAYAETFRYYRLDENKMPFEIIRILAKYDVVGEYFSKSLKSKIENLVGRV